MPASLVEPEHYASQWAAELVWQGRAGGRAAPRRPLRRPPPSLSASLAAAQPLDAVPQAAHAAGDAGQVGQQRRRLRARRALLLQRQRRCGAHGRQQLPDRRLGGRDSLAGGGGALAAAGPRVLALQTK